MSWKLPGESINMLYCNHCQDRVDIAGLRIFDLLLPP